MLTVTTSSPKQSGRGTFFCFSTSFIRGFSSEELLAAPGSGIQYYITDLVLAPGSQAGTFTFTDGTINVIDEIRIAANTMQSAGFKTPIVMTANTALGVSIDSNAGATRTVIVSGYKL